MSEPVEQGGLGGSDWLEEVAALGLLAPDVEETLADTDAPAHPAVQGNPLVPNEGIRCYAGVPLTTSRGHALGTLCVIGTEARPFSASDLEALSELADTAVRRLEARREQV